MKKSILFIIALSIYTTHTMEQTEEEATQREQSPLLQQARNTAQENLHRLRDEAKKRMQNTQKSLRNVIQNAEYALGIKIVNLSELYTLKITGGRMHSTILVEPYTVDPIKGKKYDIKYLPIGNMDSFTIEAFRPGSAVITNQLQIIRLENKDVHFINIVHMPNSNKFYGPIITDDTYSLDTAKELYPELGL